MSNGKPKAYMTKEERQALKLRELYCNPATEPNGTIEIEGDTLVEYKSRELRDIIESEGNLDHDESFQQESAETTKDPSQTEETSTDQTRIQDGQPAHETSQHEEAFDYWSGKQHVPPRLKEASETESGKYKNDVYIEDPTDSTTLIISLSLIRIQKRKQSKTRSRTPTKSTNSSSK